MAATPTPTPTPSDEVLENIDNLNDEGGGIEIIPETEEQEPRPTPVVEEIEEQAPEDEAIKEVAPVDDGITNPPEDELETVEETEMETTQEPVAPLRPLEGLEVTQYSVTEPKEGSFAAEVTYTDSEGLVYKRTINVPKNKDGTVNQDYLDEILYTQLLGVNNKRAVGVAVFKRPSEYEESTGEEEPFAET